MQKRFCSIFSQLLQVFPRTEFQRAVKETGAERHAKGFTCWQQFTAMLFCHLGQAHSLREICGGLASCEGRLSHLGVQAPPRRSTLAYANEHRPWQLYQRLFYQLLSRCQSAATGKKKKFRFRNKLLSLDASIIELCAATFDWAKYRQTKGAVKLHLVLDHEGYLPTFAVVTEGRVHEATLSRRLSFEPGTIVVFDRGYNDFSFFRRLTEQGVFFVTRMKAGTRYEVVESRSTPQRRHVLRDERIRLTGPHARQTCPQQLRRIEVRDPETERLLVFLTNHLTLGASTVAAVYRDRWQIELFFKALKQNLKVKTFVGTSPNALKTQIWTALIAMLLLKYLQFKSTYPWSLSNLVALLRMNLFVYRDLWSWLNEPFREPPPLPESLQMSMTFS
jgi:hypothetical protein